MDNTTTKKIVSFPLKVEDLNVDEAFKEDNLRIDDLLARFRPAVDGVKPHHFRIPIGDWSNDGHGQCEWFEAFADKPIEDVRGAYFAAKEKLPSRICPENFVREYEDDEVPDSVINTIQSLGGPLPDPYERMEEWLANYIVWFINQGDATVNAVIIPKPILPMLPGLDSQERPIGVIGYGLFR